MSTPLVVVFSDSNVKNSSFVEKSSDIMCAKTASCAVSLQSTDSSHWTEYKEHLFMSKSSCLSTSADSAYTLCAKVLEEMAANKRQGFNAFESQTETKLKKWGVKQVNET